MSFNPLFGVGECTAQENAFKILWMQDRRINCPTYENETFGRFYQRVIASEGIVLLPTRQLTMGRGNGYCNKEPDTRFTPVDCFNLWGAGEDLYRWGRRMESEYPWEQYASLVRDEDAHILREEIERQRSAKALQI